MKTLGLIGGISWVSTMDYYRYINKGINEQLGGLNFAQCIIYSFNFADIKKLNDDNDWDTVLKLVTDASRNLENAGADAIILCANTMHIIADRLQPKLHIPIIHIASATAKSTAARGLTKVGLLGTRFTMEKDFFKEKLRAEGIETLIPDEDDRNFIHTTIFDELGKDIFTNSTKNRYLNIIDKLVGNGAQGIILGCTEIPLLLRPEEIKVPSFDTPRIHAEAAVKFALQSESTLNHLASAPL